MARKCREDLAAGNPQTARQAELGRSYHLSDGSVDPLAFTSGHMFFNSTMQGTRGDDCTNRVDGYSMNLCPSMPHQGQTHDAGSQHNRHTVREYRGALGPEGSHNPTGLYGGAATPAEAMRRARDDARARARALVAEREEELQAQSQQGHSGGGTGTNATDGTGGAGPAPSTVPGTVQEPTAPKDQQVDGKNAPHGVLPRIEDYVKLRGLVRAREGGLCFLAARSSRRTSEN